MQQMFKWSAITGLLILIIKFFNDWINRPPTALNTESLETPCRT